VARLAPPPLEEAAVPSEIIRVRPELLECAHASFRVRVQRLPKAVRSPGDAESSAACPGCQGTNLVKLLSTPGVVGVASERGRAQMHLCRPGRPAAPAGADAPLKRTAGSRQRLLLLTRPSADAFPDRVAAVPGLRFSGDEPSSAANAPPTRLDDGDAANR
jgi:hypothetical protein